MEDTMHSETLVALEQEQQSVVGVQQSQSHTYDTVARATALPLASPRWIGQVPLVLAYAGFIGLGLVNSRLGVTWTAMRATFGMPIDAISVLLIDQLVGSVVVSASCGGLQACVEIGGWWVEDC